MSVHHRKCRSNGGTRERRNISVVPRKQHEAFHLLFENKTPEEIAQILNNIWIDPDYHFLCVYDGKNYED